MPTKATLESSLARYSDALLAKQSSTARSASLVDLDTWFRTELRENTDARKNSSAANVFLTKSELVKLMQWKLARGKWRPRLESLVASNSEASVETATRTPSFLVSPDADSDSIDIKTTMVTKMCELKGVGPATASAILAALDPRSEPFMSDQALEFVHSRKDDPNEKAGKREYTMKAWRVFREQMRTRRDEEGWESMEDLEKALWSWGTEREFGLASEDNNKRRGAHGDAGEKERKKTRKAETLTGSATKKRKS